MAAGYSIKYSQLPELARNGTTFGKLTDDEYQNNSANWGSSQAGYQSFEVPGLGTVEVTNNENGPTGQYRVTPHEGDPGYGAFANGYQAQYNLEDDGNGGVKLGHLNDRSQSTLEKLWPAIVATLATAGVASEAGLFGAAGGTGGAGAGAAGEGATTGAFELGGVTGGVEGAGGLTGLEGTFGLGNPALGGTLAGSAGAESFSGLPSSGMTGTGPWSPSGSELGSGFSQVGAEPLVVDGTGMAGASGATPLGMTGPALGTAASANASNALTSAGITDPALNPGMVNPEMAGTTDPYANETEKFARQGPEAGPNSTNLPYTPTTPGEIPVPTGSSGVPAGVKSLASTLLPKLASALIAKSPTGSAGASAGSGGFFGGGSTPANETPGMIAAPAAQNQNQQIAQALLLGNPAQPQFNFGGYQQVPDMAQLAKALQGDQYNG